MYVGLSDQYIDPSQKKPSLLTWWFWLSMLKVFAQGALTICVIVALAAASYANGHPVRVV